LKFMQSHPTINQIRQKFGTPGHSPVQEVDNLHSHIEKTFRHNEIHSPVSLVRVLKQVNLKKPLVVVQMKSFTDYYTKAKQMKINVPFVKVKDIVYHQSDLQIIHYKLSFLEESYATVQLRVQYLYVKCWHMNQF